MKREKRWCRFMKLLILLLFIPLLLPTNSVAEEEEAEKVLEEKPSGFEAWVDETHSKISGGFSGTFEAVDRFFATERLEQEEEGSRLRLGLTAIVRERELISLNPSARLRLRFPHLSRRLHLIAQGNTGTEPLDEQERVEDQLTERDGEEAQPEVSDSVALRYYHRDDQKWNISTTGGLRFRPMPDLFVRARARRLYHFTDWDLRLAAGPFVFTNRGVGVEGSMDWERPLREGVLFRAATNVVWLDDTDRYDMGENLYIFQKLDDRSGLEWRAGAFGRSQPSWRVSGYLLALTYRRQLYKDWLFLDTGPVLGFPRSEGFSATPSYFCRLEMIIGDI